MNRKNFYFITLFLIAGSAFFWYWMFQNPTSVVSAGGDGIEVTMYRSDGCDCCIYWADHLEENGFIVTDRPIENLAEFKEERGLPNDLASCHTAVIEGYVVEGHVPAREVHRLITERPDVTGIAVPGMPIGSPGMEGAFTQSYNVIVFDDAGNRGIYAQY